MRRPHKYGARKVTTIHGDFDSAGEAKWFGDLKYRELAGEISHVQRQVTRNLYAYNGTGGFHVADTILDASWVENEEIQYADFKGVLTPEARLKYKIFAANYGQQVRIFTAKGEVRLRTRMGSAAKKKGRRRANDEPAQALA